ncbi:winged helix-turn-helix transcriptional regulator [Actinocrispum wychmicini]|uniref:HxlR family transcriptional regulator n=1 Tax=Actinocrispum wychmicini TaxID=1213861 RepID=A0A4R2J9J4_9PSEU|nr:winged helix-turn-helix transcriptional regulator [Actinocrispum wychmicini]TCO55993.1 HxlR family transcriptional regulator [Actinocrispum wychmicini]
MDHRTYNQYCATARTLDLVGERWTLLLVRELLTGPKRFGDLQKSLRGMGTGLLAARMKHLEREGLAHKIVLPAPAHTPAYALTEAGLELGPAVLALARWGTKWAMGERRAGETFHPGWAVLGMEAYFDADAAAGVRAVYEFRVGEEVFHARVDNGTIDALYGPAQQPDAVITTTDDTLAELAEGRTTLAEAIRNNTVSASGDKQAIRQLRTLFRRPRAAWRGCGPTGT